MPKIKEKIYLNCTPEEAFNEMSKFDFINKINSTAGVDTKVIFQNERVIRYTISVDNVGSWESERILIPESNIIVTQRRTPLAPFKYMVVIYAFKEHSQGTQFIYVEEFEVEDKSTGKEQKIFADVLNKVGPILKNISDYFNLKD
ncbi:hypothetical protein C4L39_16435 [Clostridium diolis]|uniref:hypothetical protein n=1 Tax=Clostridium diolis TaxID=223919 RepID=UPI000D13B07F|nr:hypothetical protein [Clostridium diolis]PSM56703.1 hypothetical protein C4L39_16435 [Clostridium diolis]